VPTRTLLLPSDSRCQVRAWSETDAFVSGNGYALSCLSATDCSYLAFLYLSSLKGSEARENDTVACS
jgi:hypothetical protein